MLSIVKLSDVNGEPKAKLELPPSLRIGDPIALRFILERKTGGRTEVLKVDDKFRVIAVGLDTSRTPHKQLLSVESVGRTPTWVSVKKTSYGARRLGPTQFPRRPV